VKSYYDRSSGVVQFGVPKAVMKVFDYDRFRAIVAAAGITRADACAAHGSEAFFRALRKQDERVGSPWPDSNRQPCPQPAVRSIHLSYRGIPDSLSVVSPRRRIEPSTR
jgi:hypothetical protein